MNVLDASALLAFLQREDGWSRVETCLEAGAACSTVNWSEVAQKVLAADRDWRSASALLASYELSLEPVTSADAEWAARRWRRGENLSLADRLCLALGERLEAEVWSADRAWARYPRVSLVR